MPLNLFQQDWLLKQVIVMDGKRLRSRLALLTASFIEFTVCLLTFLRLFDNEVS